MIVRKTIREKRLGKLDASVLLSAGFEGYTQCLSRFDSSCGVKFKTYASYRIRGAVLDEVRKLIGSERLKNKRPVQVHDYDLSEVGERYSSERSLESKIDLERFINNSGLSDIEKEILTCRLTGMNLKEISEKYGFSKSWASQILKKIKKEIHAWFGAEFQLVSYFCPNCGGENYVSENVSSFVCDSCDSHVKIISGVPMIGVGDD
jgi:RNA polymerase sigma factor (sigma-70 family)